MGNCYVRHWPGLAETAMVQIEGHPIRAPSPPSFSRNRPRVFVGSWAILALSASLALTASPCDFRARARLQQYALLPGRPKKIATKGGGGALQGMTPRFAFTSALFSPTVLAGVSVALGGLSIAACARRDILAEPAADAGPPDGQASTPETELPSKDVTQSGIRIAVSEHELAIYTEYVSESDEPIEYALVTGELSNLSSKSPVSPARSVFSLLTKNNLLIPEGGSVGREKPNPCDESVLVAVGGSVTCQLRFKVDRGNTQSLRYQFPFSEPIDVAIPEPKRCHEFTPPALPIAAVSSFVPTGFRDYETIADIPNGKYQLKTLHSNRGGDYPFRTLLVVQGTTAHFAYGTPERDQQKSFSIKKNSNDRESLAIETCSSPRFISFSDTTKTESLVGYMPGSKQVAWLQPGKVLLSFEKVRR